MLRQVVAPRRYKREIARLKDLQAMKEAEMRSKKMLLEQARDPRSAGGGYMSMGGGYRGNEPQVDPDELQEDVDRIEKLLDRVEVSGRCQDFRERVAGGGKQK